LCLGITIKIGKNGKIKRLKYERFRHEFGKNNQNLEKWEIKRFRYEFGNNKKIR
jgi:hypothetical protein